MGGCRHPDMANMQIERHDAAMRIINRYVDKGQYGDSLVYCSHEEPGETGDTQHTLHIDLVPPWRMGPPIFQQERPHHRMNPDCIRVQNWSRDGEKLDTLDHEKSWISRLLATLFYERPQYANTPNIYTSPIRVIYAQEPQTRHSRNPKPFIT